MKRGGGGVRVKKRVAGCGRRVRGKGCGGRGAEDGFSSGSDRVKKKRRRIHKTALQIISNIWTVVSAREIIVPEPTPKIVESGNRWKSLFYLIYYS